MTGDTSIKVGFDDVTTVSFVGDYTIHDHYVKIRYKTVGVDNEYIDLMIPMHSIAYMETYP